MALSPVQISMYAVRSPAPAEGSHLTSIGPLNLSLELLPNIFLWHPDPNIWMDRSLISNAELLD